VVAFVRHGGKLSAEAEREAELGRVRDQADDSHPEDSMETLSDSQIDAALGELGPAWRREGDSIVADLECADFAAAIALVNRIAAEAAAADHHPDILIHGYKRLRLTLSTHSAGGLTQRDFALAAAINAL
jgi:4a-hydroxytetrahydrobiopterin dehydratase